MMQLELTSEYEGLFAGRVRLASRVEDMRSSYANAKPFPHLVMDGLFTEQLLDSLLADMAGMTSDRWKNIEQDTRERTLRMRSAADMGPAGEALLGIVHSAAFLYFLSDVTGIAHLLPDPYLQGAGYAQMRRGDYFSVHSDRNVAYETGLLRRLAMIVFLNKDWKPDYHGNLELWSHDGRRCEVGVAPLYNRTVLFEVANPNFHGVPTPLACPPDRMRRSFILYFHTANPAGAGSVKPHTSIFAPRLYGSNRVTLKSIVRDVTPPVLTRVIRKFTARD